MNQVMVVVDDFSLKCELYKNNESVYVNHLYSHIRQNNFYEIYYILQEIQVNDDILKYSLLKDCDLEILNLLISQKLKCDHFIHYVMNEIKAFVELGNQQYVEVENLREIVKGYTFNNFSDDYKLYLILPLFNSYNNIESQICHQFLHFIIPSFYKNCEYFVNQILCKGIYNANPNFVKKMLTIVTERFINFTLDISARDSHKNIIIWLLLNINKALRNKPVGWREGPDSGIWPSSNPGDYQLVFELIKPFIKV